MQKVIIATSIVVAITIFSIVCYFFIGISQYRSFMEQSITTEGVITNYTETTLDGKPALQLEFAYKIQDGTIVNGSSVTTDASFVKKSHFIVHYQPDDPYNIMVEREYKGIQKMNIIHLIIIFIGLSLSTAVIILNAEFLEFVLSAKHTKASISNLKLDTDNKTPLSAQLTFNTKDSVQSVKADQVSKRWAQGKKIGIYYNKTNPDEIRVVLLGKTLLYWSLFILGLILSIGIIAMLHFNII